MRGVLTRSLALAACLLLPGAALAAPSGTALGVDPAANAERGAENVQLVVGADIFIGDRVITGAEGLVQIKFSDKTELVVGPDSALVIEDYLLRDNGSAGKFAVNALSGTFRFVTGAAPKDQYQITTPSGTIGVRGTAFDFTVQTDVPNGPLTSVLLYEGAVILCNTSDECVTLDNYCEVGTADLSESAIVGFTDNITGEDREALRTIFQYAEDQSPLDPIFRIETALRCLKKPPEPAGSSSPGTTPGSGMEYPDEYEECDPYETECYDY